jgi:hypothetical protein
MHIVPEALNILDDSNMQQIAALRHRCQESLVKDMVTAKYDCKDIMGYIQSVSGGVLNYDFRIFDYDWDPIENAVTDYFTVSAKVLDIYKAIHIENSTKSPVF